MMAKTVSWAIRYHLSAACLCVFAAFICWHSIDKRHRRALQTSALEGICFCRSKEALGRDLGNAITNQSCANFKTLEMMKLSCGKPQKRKATFASVEMNPPWKFPKCVCSPLPLRFYCVLSSQSTRERENYMLNSRLVFLPCLRREKKQFGIETSRSCRKTSSKTFPFRVFFRHVKWRKREENVHICRA